MIFDNLGGAKLVGDYAGKWVNKNLGGKAKVALLTHEVQQTGRDRIHGAVAAIKKAAPGVQVVARHEGVLAADCLPVTQSILQAHPDINVIFCIADDGCLGAEQAFLQTKPSKARKDQMFIAGWDGSVACMKKIISGSVIRCHGSTRHRRHRRGVLRRDGERHRGQGQDPDQLPVRADLAVQPRSGAGADREVRKGVTDGAGQGRRHGGGAPFVLHARRQLASRLGAYQSGGLLVALIVLCAFFTTRSSNFLTHRTSTSSCCRSRSSASWPCRGRCSCSRGYVDLSVGSVAVLAVAVFGSLAKVDHQSSLRGRDRRDPGRCRPGG